MPDKIKYVCNHCGSENIIFDASAKWNSQKNDFELATTHDHTTCEDCDGECSVKQINVDEDFEITNVPFC